MPDLQQQLQSLADRRSAESAGDFGNVLTTAVARRRRRTALWSTAAAVVAVGGGALLNPWLQHESEPAPAASQPPARVEMAVTPATARPGATVALTFPDESGRGIAFQLAKATEPSKVLYYLTSDWGRGEHTPTWWRAGTSGGWKDVGISGPGPDRVVVPDTAEDGTYRLCTANAARQVCGLLTVRR